MTGRTIFIVLLAGLAAGAARGADVVVAGVAFPPAVEQAAGDGKVSLTLTGAAVRQKLFVNVYAIASYVQAGVPIRTPEQLAAADVPKCLHLVMLRGVTGKDVADAFYVAIRQNYPDPAFQTELAALHDLLKDGGANKGDHIWLCHSPGVGLHIDFAGKPFTIRNPAFSRAVWDVYLGKNNLGEAIKRGLVSRLQ